MNTNTIDPTSFDTNHPLAAAMRNVSEHWFLAYSKLMSLQWEWSDTVTYGATDGRRLLLSKTGIDKLCQQRRPAQLISFLLVHEALHALLGHGWRLSKMTDKKLANIAADYIINAMIHNRNKELRKEVFPLIEGVLLDESLSGDLSVEQLYRQLNKPQPQPEPEPQPEPNEDNESDSGSDDSSDDSDAGSDDTATGSEDSDAADSDDGDGGTDSSRDMSDFVGTGSEDTMMTEAEEDMTVEEVIEKVEEDNDRILIADDIERRKQSESGETGTRITQQRTTVAPLQWPDLLREWLTKRSRRGWDAPFNAPIYQSTGLISADRRTKRAGEIVLVLDTSGSIRQQTYERFLAEAASILDELKPEKLHLLSVSHVVADAVTLECGDMVPDKLKGGGGTRFLPAFEWVAVNVVDPDVMVYLTDGLSDDLGRVPVVDFPLLWLSTYTPAHYFKVGDVIEVNDM